MPGATYEETSDGNKSNLSNLFYNPRDFKYWVWHWVFEIFYDGIILLRRIDICFCRRTSYYKKDGIIKMDREEEPVGPWRSEF